MNGIHQTNERDLWMSHRGDQLRGDSATWNVVDDLWRRRETIAQCSHERSTRSRNVQYKGGLSLDGCDVRLVVRESFKGVDANMGPIRENETLCLRTRRDS